MREIKETGTDNYNTFVEIINDYNLSGEDVLQLLTDYHGTQLLDRDFMENLIDCEGYN